MLSLSIINGCYCSISYSYRIEKAECFLCNIEMVKALWVFYYQGDSWQISIFYDCWCFNALWCSYTHFHRNIATSESVIVTGRWRLYAGESIQCDTQIWISIWCYKGALILCVVLQLLTVRSVTPCVTFVREPHEHFKDLAA